MRMSSQQRRLMWVGAPEHDLLMPLAPRRTRHGRRPAHTAVIVAIAPERIAAGVAASLQEFNGARLRSSTSRLDLAATQRRQVYGLTLPLPWLDWSFGLRLRAPGLRQHCPVRFGTHRPAAPQRAIGALFRAGRLTDRG